MTDEAAPSDPPTTSTSARSRRRAVAVGVVLAAIVIGALAGLFAGRSIASDRVASDTEAAERASTAEDDARDRRDLLEARLDAITPQVEALEPITTTGPLLASKATKELEPGTTFSVDGGTYTVNALQVVDAFESKDPRRPGSARDGSRWVLIDMDYRNDTKEDQFPACGTTQTVRVVLEDSSTINEERDQPPVHPDTYDMCGVEVPPGKSGRWLAPIEVPEGSVIGGIHVADVYARNTGSPYNVVSGAPVWMPLDDPLDVGSQGDDERTLTFGKDAS